MKVPVEVAAEKVAVEAPVAPIGVLFMDPPEIVTFEERRFVMVAIVPVAEEKVAAPSEEDALTVSTEIEVVASEVSVAVEVTLVREIEKIGEEDA